MRDLFSDLNNCLTANWRYASETVSNVGYMMSPCPVASARLSKLWILCLNDLLDGYLFKKLLYFHTFSFFLGFKHDSIRCVDFTRIAASNTASDNVTSEITHRIFNTDWLYSCAHFVVEIDEKSSLNGRFQYDLMMIRDNGLLFGPPCISRRPWMRRIWRNQNLNLPRP